MKNKRFSVFGAQRYRSENIHDLKKILTMLYDFSVTRTEKPEDKDIGIRYMFYQW